MGHDGTEMCPAVVLFKAPTRAIFALGIHHACTTGHAACTTRAFYGIFFSFVVSQKKRKNDTNAGWVQITRRRCKAPPGALLPKEHAAMRLLQGNQASGVGSGGRSQVLRQQVSGLGDRPILCNFDPPTKKSSGQRSLLLDTLMLESNGCG